MSNSFSEVKTIPNYVSLSNAIAFVSYFLGSILLGSFLFLLAFVFDVFISFFFEIFTILISPKYIMPFENLINTLHPNNFSRGSP